MAEGYDPFRIRALVPEFEALQAEYKTLSAAARGRWHGRLDIPYGRHPRERLDLFLPAPADVPAPVHIFVHGGYWRANDKEDYAFVAETACAAGAIAVIVEYPLMPASRLGDLVGAVRRAGRWVNDNIAAHGGDPAMLSVSGHSAGAHLALYLAALEPGLADFSAITAREALLLSGIYDLAPIPQSFLQPEIGLTAEEIARWSPVSAGLHPVTRFVLAVGEKETEPFHAQAAALAAHAEDHGIVLERHVLAGHDHMTIVRDLGMPGTEMAGLLVETIDASRH